MARRVVGCVGLHGYIAGLFIYLLALQNVTGDESRKISSLLIFFATIDLLILLARKGANFSSLLNTPRSYSRELPHDSD